MSTVKAQQHKWLLKKFHSLCTQGSIPTDTKLAMIEGYGVESSKDLTNAQLMELCEYLDGIINPESAKADKLRKRLIAAIGGWLRAIGRDNEGIGYIKSVACRAAGCENFNRIPPERLTNLYNMFVKKLRDAEAVAAICGEIENEQRFGKFQQLN